MFLTVVSSIAFDRLKIALKTANILFSNAKNKLVIFAILLVLVGFQNSAFAQDKSPSFEHLKKAQKLMIADDFESASREIDEALKLDEKNAEAYKIKGNMFFMQKNYQNAIDNYSKAIELNENYSDAYSNRGSSYYRMEKLDEALKDLNKAIELKPDHEKALYNRALLFEKKKDYKRAIEDYSAVIKLNPEDDEAASSRRDLFKKSGFYQKAASSKIEVVGANKSIKTIVMPDVIFKSEYHHDRIDSIMDFLDEASELKIPAKNLPSNALEAIYVEYYYSEVMNGGLRQFVYNSKWDKFKIEKIRSGLQNMGATKHLAVFDLLTAVIGSLKTRPVLDKNFSASLAVLKPELEILNGEFYIANAAESIEELNYQYIGNFKNLELSAQY